MIGMNNPKIEKREAHRDGGLPAMSVGREEV